jgi:hypothetical protein
MATLTAEQRADLQADIGITDDESVFTDDELDRLYTRAGEDYNLTVVYALRQLLVSAARLTDYTAGQTSEKLSQIREGLKASLDYYEKQVVGAGNQVLIRAMRAVPPVYKEVPENHEHPDETNNRYGMPARRYLGGEY